MGRHVASFHLAQLWRCPMSWCTIWRGTPQDCIDHMRSAHAVPVTVKASNLARWFPPWTVSRDRWCAAMSSTVSRVATDALLFSRTGVPLVHPYGVFSRAGTHVAFRGTYMARLRTFIYILLMLRGGNCVAGTDPLHLSCLLSSRSLPRLRSRWLLWRLVHAGPADGPLLVRSISRYPGLLFGIISRRYISLCG